MTSVGICTTGMLRSAVGISIMLVDVPTKIRHNLM